MDTQADEFCTQLLQWPIQKRHSDFRAYVVEPGCYDSPGHADIFNAALMALAKPESGRALDAADTSSPILSASADFDLVTFPEAFLLSEALISALDNLSWLDNFGCVHVGLRPDTSDKNHLFETHKVVTLVSRLAQLKKTCSEDFAGITRWLDQQVRGQYFNHLARQRHPSGWAPSLDRPRC